MSGEAPNRIYIFTSRDSGPGTEDVSFWVTFLILKNMRPKMSYESVHKKY